MMEQKKLNEMILFPDIFWQTNILNSIDNEKLIEFAYETKKNDKGLQISNSLGYHSSYLDVSDKSKGSFKNLIDEIVPLVENIFKERFYNDPKSKLYSFDAWININPKYSYNKQHIHGGNVVLSMVYYAKVPKDSGNFYFKSPSSRADKISSLKIDKSNIFSTYRESLPSVGDLLIFPGWIEHGVNQNMSDEDRISYAFNCRVKDGFE